MEGSDLLITYTTKGVMLEQDSEPLGLRPIIANYKGTEFVFVKAKSSQDTIIFIGRAEIDNNWYSIIHADNSNIIKIWKDGDDKCVGCYFSEMKFPYSTTKLSDYEFSE